MKWYVVQVRSGLEEDVRQRLADKGYAARIPRERRELRRRGAWREVNAILMPGYVFLGVKELRDSDYHRIRHIPGVLRLLGEPTPISEAEAAFWRLESTGAALEPSTLALDAAGRPVVLSGPLLGREADIVWVNRRHRRAGVRVRAPFGERIIKFSVIVATLPARWLAAAAVQETGRKAGSMHSPAARTADTGTGPGDV